MSIISVPFFQLYTEIQLNVCYLNICLSTSNPYLYPIQEKKKKTFQIDKYFSEHVPQAIRMAHESLRENKIMLLKAFGRSLSVERVRVGRISDFLL